MPIGPARMPLMDHIAELRRRLTVIVVSVLLCAIVVYMFTPQIIQFLIAPIKKFLPGDGNLVILSSLGGFTIRFKVAVFSAVIITSPIIIWQLMGFFLPALKPKERKWVVPTVLALVLLFLLGMIFCYLVILSAAFGWMIDQSVAVASLAPNAEDYLGILMLLEIGFGVAFEVPLVIFYLATLHIVPYKTFRNNWRIIYVVLLVFSAMVTPDASPVTMFFMFAALVLLYEASLAVARQIIVARDGAEALKWSREDYSEHADKEDE